MRINSWRNVVRKHSTHESISRISSNWSVRFHESRNTPLFTMYIRLYRTDNNRQYSTRSRSSCLKEEKKKRSFDLIEICSTFLQKNFYNHNEYRCSKNTIDRHRIYLNNLNHDWKQNRIEQIWILCFCFYPIKDLIKFESVDVKHRRNMSDKIDFIRRVVEGVVPVDSIRSLINDWFCLLIWNIWRRIRWRIGSVSSCSTFELWWLNSISDFRFFIAPS